MDIGEDGRLPDGSRPVPCGRITELSGMSADLDDSIIGQHNHHHHHHHHHHHGGGDRSPRRKDGHALDYVLKSRSKKKTRNSYTHNENYRHLHHDHDDDFSNDDDFPNDDVDIDEQQERGDRKKKSVTAAAASLSNSKPSKRSLVDADENDVSSVYETRLGDQTVPSIAVPC